MFTYSSVSDRIIKPLGGDLRKLTSVVIRKGKMPVEYITRHTCYRQTQVQPSMSRDSQWFVMPATVKIHEVCQVGLGILQQVIKSYLYRGNVRAKLCASEPTSFELKGTFLM
jgi:hypothetical protein